jgi:hypothetical protein
MISSRATFAQSASTTQKHCPTRRFVVSDRCAGGGPRDEDETSMDAVQQTAQKLILAVAATLIMLATGVRAVSEEPLFSPNPSVDSSRSDQTELHEKSSSAIKQDNNSTKWTRVPQDSPFTDLHWRSFGTDFSKNIGGSNGLKNSRDASSMSGSTNPNDKFRLGNSYLGIQTQKSLQSPESLRRSDCATDDECAEYSGLPKSEPRKTTVKNLRMPFIGLSVTAPLH